MTYQEWQKLIKEIHLFLEKQELKNVFDTLRILIAELREWNTNEQLDELENTYKIMLHYMQNGTEDPERNNVYEGLLRSVYNLIDDVQIKFQIKNSPKFYFEKKRAYHALQTYNLKNIKNNLEEINGKIALNNLLKDNNEEKTSVSLSLEKELETVNIQLFNYLWLSNKWSSEEKETVTDLIKSRLYPDISKNLILSAIILNLQFSFDENKLLLLMDFCEDNNEEISQRALIGLLIILRQYDTRVNLYQEIEVRLQHFMENPGLTINIRNILLQLILSKDTEKITRKIKDELFPEMMKINPILSKKINIEDLMNESGFDDKNPEWQNLIEESGLGSKLQEFSELQMEGADVMHSSFSHLKTYSFFNELSNWFLPFTKAHSIFNGIFEGDSLSKVVDALTKSTLLCNSDKYSLYLSISQMPESYRKMVAGQFSAEAEAINEMQESELPDHTKKIKNISNQYIHDLYRFYKLYPKKNDFPDIFEMKPEFYKAQTIRKLINDNESLLIIGEYYFSRNYFSEAVDIFNDLLSREPDNHILYQKKAYSLQMLDRIDEALDAYLKAELLNHSNTWILKKIAYCYRLLKQPKEALIYYRKVEQINPDNLSVQMNIGHCYLELKNYKEALKYYFKVEYLDSNSNRAWRPIAWCSFLLGKYEQAESYYKKILSDDNPDASDYLNAGHTQLAMKNIKNAIDYYSKSASKITINQFSNAFYNDWPDLLNAGISKDDIPFFMDQIRYTIDNIQ